MEKFYSILSSVIDTTLGIRSKFCVNKLYESGKKRIFALEKHLPSMITSHDALKFVSRWQGRGNEKSETQAFWVSILQDLLHIPDPYSYIAFEKEIRLSYDTARRQHRGFIDAFIQARSILIEQKSLGVDLEAPRGKNELSALQQARRYAEALPKSLQPNYIVTCNFEQFLIFFKYKHTCISDCYIYA